MGDTPVYRRILAALDGRAYCLIEHRPVSTAEQAAEARGTPLALGAKTILLRVRREMVLLALAADRALDNRAVKRRFGTTNTRFATTDELAELTGLERGAVPPFGPPVLPFPLYVDAGLAAWPEIVFTAGRRDRSILIATEVWLAVAGHAESFAFAREPV